MHPLPVKHVVGLLLETNSVHKRTYSAKYHCMVMAVVTA